jgi:oligopeptide/dipeptide ABC transporter ATP-binding protein
MVRHISDRVAVMYLGRIVELASKGDLFGAPRHPYTRGLLEAVPVPDPAARRRKESAPIPGDVPDAASPPSGCSFHPRCPFATEVCRQVDPVLEDLSGGERSHRVACHHARELS